MTQSNATAPYQIDPELVEKIMREFDICAAKGGPSLLGAFRRMSRQEYLELITESLAPIDVYKLIAENAYAIKDYPQFSFRSHDGRAFGIFFCGEVILKLFKREGVSINYRDKAGVERLKSTAGFILETSDEDATAHIYETAVELTAAWERLHNHFGLAIADDKNGSVEWQVNENRISRVWNATLTKCKQEHLSRRVRGAVSMMGMVPVTVLSMMCFHYGHVAAALAYESIAIAVYAVWVSIGKDFGPPEVDETDSDLDF